MVTPVVTLVLPKVTWALWAQLPRGNTKLPWGLRPQITLGNGALRAPITVGKRGPITYG